MGYRGYYTGTPSRRVGNYYMPARSPARHIESILAFSLAETSVSIVVPFSYGIQHKHARYQAYEHEEAS
jgi:hypothetical protein